MADTQTLGEAQVNIRANVGKLPGDLDGVNKTVSKALTSFGKFASKTVVAGVAMLGAAVVGIGTAAFASGMQLDDVYDTIMIKTGATGQALEGLKGDFAAVFKAVPTDAATAADALSLLSDRTGLTGLSLQGLTEQLLEMSRLTKTDATTNGELFTRMLGDWGIKTADASNAMDLLFVAGQKAGVGVDSLMTNVVQFGAPLRLMGFNLQDSVSMFAKWEKEGVNSETVMGSLRIAAGKFADAQTKSNTTVIGGVDSMADATSQLGDLEKNLQIATLQQGEFNDKTKESAKVAKQAQIDKFTKQIGDLRAAMALGEKQTITSAKATTTLGESLRESMTAIRDNADASAALALGMDVFGAKAAPDMVAAIREGRFNIDEFTASLGNVDGAILKTATDTMDFPEKLTMIKNKLALALAPSGLTLMDAFTTSIDNLQPALDKLGPFIDTVVAPAMERLAAAVVDLSNGDVAGALSTAFGSPGEITATITGPVNEVGGAIGGMVVDAIRGVFGLPKSVDDTSTDLEKMLKDVAYNVGQTIPSIAGAIGRGFISNIFGGNKTSAAAAETIFPSTPQPFGQGNALVSSNYMTEAYKILGTAFPGPFFNHLIDMENIKTIDYIENLYKTANEQAQEGFIASIAETMNAATSADISLQLNSIQDPGMKKALMDYLLKYGSDEVLPKVEEAIREGVTGTAAAAFNTFGNTDGASYGSAFSEAVLAQARADGVLGPLLEGTNGNTASIAAGLGVSAAQSWQGGFSQQFSGWMPPQLKIDINGNMILPQAVPTPAGVGANYLSFSGAINININSPNAKTAGNSVTEELKKYGAQW
jgi:phage-related minor tail protein